MIPYGRQNISEADIEAVVEVLRSDWLTQGPKVPEFEQAVANYCGANHAVAVNSATSALHIACMALDVGPGDIVWTSPNTFVASANCARYCGAEVDFVDIDPNTWNLCPQQLAEKLAEAEKTHRLPKVVIPVHLCGQSCDMAAIHALSKQYGFYIIEDASHAIGGRYRNEPVGNCRYSNIVVFSFHPVKIITTAEGGMAVTNNSELAERMSRLRTHGITKDPAQMQNTPTGPWYYEQLELGYNYRMTDLQAALGISQLERLDAFVAKRNNLAKRYDELLSDLPLRLPKVIDDAYSSWHLYPVRLRLDEVKRTHLEVFEGLREADIGVNLHYMPVHLQPYYRGLGFEEGMFSEAEAYGRDAISLPMYPELADGQAIRVMNAIELVLTNFRKNRA
jgi:UDP-4-amino-4,6-dideoxy-N-acetyl-beta-L-altrosamine transaminase